MSSSNLEMKINVHDEIFSKYSYAVLTKKSQTEIQQFLDLFYSGCQLLKVDYDPETNLGKVFQLLQSCHGVICFPRVGENNGSYNEFYYAEFDAESSKHNLQLINVGQHKDFFSSFEFPESGVCIQANAEELKSIRQVTDCMRFKTPAVLAMFEQRKSRQHVLANSDALLDNLIPDALPFYDAAQVQHLDEALRFALFHYLAQAQAAEDHIGVIRHQHKELATCYKRIKQCTLFRKQLELRQLKLDLEALHLAALNKEDPKPLTETCKNRYRAVNFSQNKDTYQLFINYKETQELNWQKYEQLEVLNRQLKKAKSDRFFGNQTTANPLVENQSIHQTKIDPVESITQSRNDLKAEIILMDAAVESLKPGLQASYLPSFLKEDEDEDDSDYVLFQLNKFNQRRLFWVWTRCMLEILIVSAHQILLVSTQIAAWISWSLYWLRGGIEAAAGIQHSFDSMVSEREKVITAHKRALAHWQERYDNILNDLGWGSVNFACCFWLLGAGLLGMIGDALTLIFLGMDLTLATLRWHYGKKAHEDKVKAYDDQLKSLIDQMTLSHPNNQNINSLKATYMRLDNLKQQNSFNPNPLKIYDHEKQLKDARAEIDAQLAKVYDELSKDQHLAGFTGLHFKSLYSDKQAYLQQWQNQWATLGYDIAYAVALAAAFGLLCFSPIVGLSVFGAILLYASTVMWRGAYAYTDIGSTERAIADIEAQYFTSLACFKNYCKPNQDKIKQNLNLNTNDSMHSQALVTIDLKPKECPEPKMKQLYLQIRALGAKSGFERELKRFKQVEFARDTFMRIAVPIAIALTFLLAPATLATIPTYVFLLLGILVLALVSASAIHYGLKPKASAWQKGIDSDLHVSSTVCFQNEEYEAFKQLVNRDSETQTQTKNLPSAVPIKLLGMMQTERCGKNAKLMRNLTTDLVPS